MVYEERQRVGKSSFKYTEPFVETNAVSCVECDVAALTRIKASANPRSAAEQYAAGLLQGTLDGIVAHVEKLKDQRAERGNSSAHFSTTRSH